MEKRLKRSGCKTADQPVPGDQAGGQRSFPGTRSNNDPCCLDREDALRCCHLQTTFLARTHNRVPSANFDTCCESRVGQMTGVSRPSEDSAKLNETERRVAAMPWDSA